MEYKLYLSLVASSIMSCLTALSQSCCIKPEGMAQFATVKEFQHAHIAPKPFALQNAKGRMIDLAVQGEAPGAAYFVPAPKATPHVLFIFHEWWGLNDYIKQEAERWQAALGNVEVYAIDLYDGKVADNAEKAGQYMQNLNAARAEKLIEATMQLAGSGKKFATVGWCMGGSWSFQAARLAGANAKACVMYYGFPETQTEKLKQIQSDILFIHATEDAFISNDLVFGFEKSLKELGKKIQLLPFEADHAFANPSNPKHHENFSKQAFEASLAFIKERLK